MQLFLSIPYTMNIKRHITTYSGQVFNYNFYDLKITFEYTGVISKNSMSKYKQEV